MILLTSFGPALALDIDDDCDVDQSDFGLFQANLTGPTTVCEPSPEVCDGVDNDCNCLIDDDAIDGTNWYPVWQHLPDAARGHRDRGAQRRDL